MTHTPTNTPTATATFTPTNTPTATATPTNTPIPREPNDALADAQAVTTMPFVAQQSTLYAESDSADPQPSCANPIDQNLWYQFTPDESATYQMHTIRSDHDVALVVYMGTEGNLTELGCDTNSAPNGQAILRMPLISESTYYIMLGANDGQGGMAQLTVQQIASPTATPVPSSTPLPTRTPMPLTTTVGLYDAQTGLWQFRETNANGIADVVFNWSIEGANWQAIVGDWDGDGVDGIGLYHEGIWLLRNSTTIGEAAIQVNFGLREAGWQPIVGDWNGDGIDDFGLYKDGQFMLSYGPDSAGVNMMFTFNPLGQGGTPIAGDWDGRDGDTVGLYNAGQWLLADANMRNSSANVFLYGEPDWQPIVGDWNQDGIDTIGGYRNGRWYLRDSNNAGAPTNAFAFDGVGVPLTGYRGSIPALMTLSENLVITPMQATTTATAEATATSPEATFIPNDTATPMATSPTTPTVMSTVIPINTPAPSVTASLIVTSAP
ncbi:MAG: hypothetical protein AAF126_13015 [Chloroflexota bacterium]